MREICLCCGYAIPEAIGRSVPCSEYHVRCSRCEWPVERSHLSPKGLCEVCMEDAQRREDELKQERTDARAIDRGLLRVTERELILRTLAEKNGNRTHAARALGICVRTMRNKLREYRIVDTGRSQHRSEVVSSDPIPLDRDRLANEVCQNAVCEERSRPDSWYCSYSCEATHRQAIRRQKNEIATDAVRGPRTETPC